MSRATLLHSTIGSYRLTDFLGAGGMGEVYQAVHVQNGYVAAVKVLINMDRRSTFVERFRNEADIQAQLHHPGIARLYEYHEVEGRPCIVMEYVDGLTLDDKIRGQGALPVGEALTIFQAVVEAVAYLHRQGIVHRDIKTSNIKISTSGQVKLLDFGIAKGEFTRGLTATGVVIGTPECLSPEQVRGHPADVRSDVWSLGVLLYEMLTGHIPFEGSNVLALYEKISKASFTPPSVLNPAISPHLETIVGRCLKKRPSDRYPSAAELLLALDPHTERSASAESVLDKARHSLAGIAPWVKKLRIALHNKMGSRAPKEAPSKGRVPTALRRIPGHLRQMGQEVRQNAPMVWQKHSKRILAGVAVFVVLLFGFALSRWITPTHNLTVTIRTEEGNAYVYHPNGLPLGPTPYRFSGVPNTEAVFVLKRPGYADKEVRILVSEQRTDYVFSMGGAGTQSVLISDAEGKADVYLPNGEWLGEAPYSYQGVLNTQTQLVLKRPGYRDEVINVDINERRKEYVIPMEKIQR